MSDTVFKGPGWSRNVPVEVRIWVPDGPTVRIRAYLDELKTERETFGGFLYEEREQFYVPLAQTYRLVAHGPGWRMDGHGKPVPHRKERDT